MIPDGSRNTNLPGFALTLKPDGNVYAVTVKIRAVCDCITDVHPDTEPNGSLWWLFTIVVGHLLLHLDRKPHGAIDAVKGNEERVTASLHQPTAILVDRWIDQRTP